jgi:NAD(P)-dependent dehydrogenase (short-subunit alcohol dehydrogenase family)
MTEPGIPPGGNTGTGAVGAAGMAADGEFSGLSALVTGGASGIGLATARLLASQGARVVVLDRDVTDSGHGLAGVVADVTDDRAVRRAVGEAAAAPDPGAERAALEARQPMGRLVSAEEVAAAIAYLASPVAGATTGTALAVDGGMAGLRLRPWPQEDR